MALSIINPKVYAIALVETLRILRDRTSFSLVVMVPILQILLFGAAININPNNVSVAVAGGSPSTQNTAQSIIQETGYFDTVTVGLAAGEALKKMERGDVQVAIEMPDDAALFEALENESADQSEHSVSGLRLFADGADPAAVGPAVAALEAAAVRRQLTEHIGGNQSSGELIWLYNPERDSRWVTLPALVGVIVMISSLMLGALAIVREREQGTWNTLLASPASKGQILLGKIIPYIAISATQILLSIGIAVVLFDVPVNGSLVALLLGAILTATIYLLMGFIVSVSTMSQLQALQTAVALYLPSILLSGFMFPFSAMPSWAQYIGKVMPLTHYVNLSRDTMLRGFGMFDVLVQLGVLACLTVILTVVAVRFFHAKA